MCVLIRCWWACCTLDHTTSLRSMAWWSLGVSGCRTWLLCTREHWHRLVHKVVSHYGSVQLIIMPLHFHILCYVPFHIPYFARSNIKPIFRYLYLNPNSNGLVVHDWLIRTHANILGFNLLKTGARKYRRKDFNFWVFAGQDRLYCLKILQILCSEIIYALCLYVVMVLVFLSFMLNNTFHSKLPFSSLKCKNVFQSKEQASSQLGWWFFEVSHSCSFSLERVSTSASMNRCSWNWLHRLYLFRSKYGNSEPW